MFSCPSCSSQNTSFKKLYSHWKTVHGLSPEQLYFALHSLTVAPTCECGCGKPTKFLSVLKGYTKFNRGHNNLDRVFTDEQREKSREKHKENVALGLWKPKEKPTRVFDSTREFKCPDCPDSYDKLISLSLHYRRGHKKTARDLYVALWCQGTNPACECGCGTQTTFMDITRGFYGYVMGHNNRVPGQNNWGSNKTARENSLTTRRKMIQEGTWKPFHEKETGEHWAVGKTAETDARVAKRTTNLRNNPEELARRSKRMKENRLNGTIPTLKGADSGQWKGGISSLMHTCRTNHRLYTEWKYPILLRSKFMCEMCGKTKTLEVHHDKETFSEIYSRIATEKGWQKKLSEGLNPDKDLLLISLKQKISDDVTDFHIQNKVSGITLCHVCHRSLHKNKKI